MVTMTVETEQMNLQNIAKVKAVLALVIYSHVIMETVYLGFISVMVIMTVWITVTKINVISAVRFLLFWVLSVLCVF